MTEPGRATSDVSTGREDQTQEPLLHAWGVALLLLPNSRAPASGTRLLGLHERDLSAEQTMAHRGV